MSDAIKFLTPVEVDHVHLVAREPVFARVIQKPGKVRFDGPGGHEAMLIVGNQRADNGQQITVCYFFEKFRK